MVFNDAETIVLENSKNPQEEQKLSPITLTLISLRYVGTEASDGGTFSNEANGDIYMLQTYHCLNDTICELEDHLRAYLDRLLDEEKSTHSGRDPE